ncbi:decapping endonuclease targeting mRNA [Coniosporium tulheliwenetii]|uniref:Decapping endonuclease targeting mRNA n=1 Tax=Coniosporium tulheliwenetii TaxID=3383036 RepID=A0ACC2Z793_9PEZI|nr:decapping endonuclease targeting mRNA [Cladosporium sp. JES 115]
MAVPFDNFNEFIEENHAAKLASRAQQMKQQSRPGAPSQELMSYWGYKFETLCLIPDKWDAVSRDYIENRENEVVSNYAQYCSVVRTGIGNASLVIGGEVDAVWDCKPDDKDQPINWVELKTAQDFGANGNLLTFERKLLKFWIQSFLLGVPKIIVGFRSPDGILQRVEELETQKIPGNVKRSGKASWDGNLCINFTAAFLAFLKETITSDGVWRIWRRKNSPAVEVFKMEETGHGSILSTEFVEWRQQMAAQAHSQP